MNGRPKSMAKKTDLRAAWQTNADRALAVTVRLGDRVEYVLGRLPEGQLPDEALLESFKAFTRSVAELGRLLSSAPQKSASELTDAQYAEELRIVTIELLRKATPEERAALIAEADGPEHPTLKINAIGDWA